MRSDNKDETKYILKLLFTLMIAIVAVSFAYSLAKPDIYGESRLTTLDYIPVEKAIKNKDYNEAYELLQAMCKKEGIKWNLYLRYYTYFGACKLFDDGNYKAAYENFDKIRGFRDVDSFYKKEEYEYLKLCGTWYMVDSQINADFILSISGKQMVVTTIEYGYYDSQTNEISFTLVKKDNKYIMQQSDGQCDYYLTFFGSKLELREYDTGSLIGTFVCEDAE